VMAANEPHSYVCHKDPFIKDSTAMVASACPRILPVLPERGDYSRSEVDDAFRGIKPDAMASTWEQGPVNNTRYGQKGQPWVHNSFAQTGTAPVVPEERGIKSRFMPLPGIF